MAKGTEEKPVCRGRLRYMVHNNNMDVQALDGEKGQLWVGSLW